MIYIPVGTQGHQPILASLSGNSIREIKCKAEKIGLYLQLISLFTAFKTGATEKCIFIDFKITN